LDLCVCAFHFIIHSLLFDMMLMRFLSFDVHLICILHIPSQKSSNTSGQDAVARENWIYHGNVLKTIWQSKVGWDVLNFSNDFLTQCFLMFLPLYNIPISNSFAYIVNIMDTFYGQ
jgi:hypothetical protein